MYIKYVLYNYIIESFLNVIYYSQATFLPSQQLGNRVILLSLNLFIVGIFWGYCYFFLCLGCQHYIGTSSLLDFPRQPVNLIRAGSIPFSAVNCAFNQRYFVHDYSGFQRRWKPIDDDFFYLRNSGIHVRVMFLLIIQSKLKYFSSIFTSVHSLLYSHFGFSSQAFCLMTSFYYYNQSLFCVSFYI